VIFDHSALNVVTLGDFMNALSEPSDDVRRHLGGRNKTQPDARRATQQ
jgi:hypothetical protein